MNVNANDEKTIKIILSTGEIVEAKEIVQGEIYSQQITPKNKYPCMLTLTELKELFDKVFS